MASPIKALMTDSNSKKRPTIGFLSANIHVGASRVLWPGILDAAVSENVNLICFPGGGLNAAEESEAMRNLIYQPVDENRSDGLHRRLVPAGGDASEIASSETYIENGNVKTILVNLWAFWFRAK